ncbi:hypothetical protein SDC9_167838 [bioreactor metagenome]|uniref:Uncharacterized protein n=1 Tax=bioreactor metagenome TaxID=1076179 RepID=A0A645G3R9_9ZZZZ
MDLGCDLDEQGPKQHARPQTQPENQQGRQRNAGGRKDWRSVAGGYGKLEGRPAKGTVGKGQGDNPE